VSPRRHAITSVTLCGANDGIITTFAVVAGVAGGAGTLIAGIVAP